MSSIVRASALSTLAGLVLVVLSGTAVAAVDEAAALALARKSDCLKCHSVDKKKDGPSYKETAAK